MTPAEKARARLRELQSRSPVNPAEVIEERKLSASLQKRNPLRLGMYDLLASVADGVVASVRPDARYKIRRYDSGLQIHNASGGFFIVRDAGDDNIDEAFDTFLCEGLLRGTSQ